jgi:hypothetical protein
MLGRARFLTVLAFPAAALSACTALLGDFSETNAGDASTQDGSVLEGSIQESSTDSPTSSMDAGKDVITASDVTAGDAPQESSTGCTGASTESCTSCGTETRTCDAGAWSAWSACMNQVNTNTDIDNCGTCGHTCQQPGTPSHGLCVTGVCTEYVGGYSAVTGTNTLDPMGSTIYAVQAPLGTAGTFQGITAVVDSTAQSIDVEFALWADNGMETAPGALLWWVETTIPQTNVPTVITATANQSGATFTDAGTGAPSGLAPGMYWVSIHPNYATDNVAPVSASSTSPCVEEQWINIEPPSTWAYAGQPTTCPSMQQYMTVTF